MPWRNELCSQHADRKAASLWRELRTLESSPGRTVTIAGKSFLNFCSNNYLSLANHRQLVAAANAATEKYGTGATASHLIIGHNTVHQQLESRIAEFVGAEKSILFSTGYMANSAVPTTFLGRNDLIVQDRLNHASMIDGARLSTAKLQRYPHCDSVAAEQILTKRDLGRKMLTTDGVFSMDGSIAPLADLKTICDRHHAMLVVDDAHGFGVVGDTGQGCLSSCGLGPRGNTLMLGTLSKAAASFGAFVAGDAIYIDTLVQHARPFIYTTALPTSAAAAALKAIELFEAETWRRAKLVDNIAQFRKLAVAAGVPLTESTTPIQPISVGDSQSALQLANHLQQNGIMAIAIRPPTVPSGQSRVRITLMTDHTREDIENLIAVLKSAP